MNINEVNVGGNQYEIEDSRARQMVSDQYNQDTQYKAGDLCIYENELKKANKSTTGIYNPADWTPATIQNEIAQLNSNMPYVDLKNFIDTGDSGITILNAFAENNCVCITIKAPNGRSGIVKARLTNLKYAPRAKAIGTTSVNGETSDGGKIVSKTIESNGEIVLWIKNNITAGVTVSYVYPMKNS